MPEISHIDQFDILCGMDDETLDCHDVLAMPDRAVQKTYFKLGHYQNFHGMQVQFGAGWAEPDECRAFIERAAAILLSDQNKNPGLP